MIFVAIIDNFDLNMIRINNKTYSSIWPQFAILSLLCLLYAIFYSYELLLLHSFVLETQMKTGLLSSDLFGEARRMLNLGRVGKLPQERATLLL